MTMNKNEYEISAKTNLTTAEALCADLRKLRNLQKLAQSITGHEELVSMDKVSEVITTKEAELKKVRCELQKARRVLKKLEEIEAIEAGTEPQLKKPTTKKAAAKDSSAKEQPKAKAPAKPKAKKSTTAAVEAA